MLKLSAYAANRRVLYTISAEMMDIDEVGLEQVERKEACRSGLMQKVLLPRYNEQRSSIIARNIPWEAGASTPTTISGQPPSSTGCCTEATSS